MGNTKTHDTRFWLKYKCCKYLTHCWQNMIQFVLICTTICSCFYYFFRICEFIIHCSDVLSILATRICSVILNTRQWLIFIFFLSSRRTFFFDCEGLHYCNPTSSPPTIYTPPSNADLRPIFFSHNCAHFWLPQPELYTSQSPLHIILPSAGNADLGSGWVSAPVQCGPEVGRLCSASRQ